ncbi:MAG TPA: hypothetical protein VFA31_06360 [Candidatus Polarisedimenticolia bacterium]|jgi:hypothetical protein|nr:hypothetical protein [Candidatus Polarisedimenticolia bacterium]
MAVNLAVMDVVGRQEAPVFTWNPVEQMWVQERGGAAKPPPSPHDIHAIQTWFLDTEDNEWIQTVLGPMGRQLAAQWRGAYRVPDAAITREAKSAKKRSPLPILVGAIVLIALIGGVAVAAPGLMNPNATPAPSGPIAASNVPAPSASAEPTAEPTPEPTPEPTVAPATPVPATPRPRPVGPSYTLKNGTVVTYTGPVTAARNSTLPASFTVTLANGRAAAGSFGIFLNDPVTVSNRRAVNGTLDGNGRILLQVPTNVQPGVYQLLFSYGGETAQITTVAVR